MAVERQVLLRLAADDGNSRAAAELPAVDRDGSEAGLASTHPPLRQTEVPS